MTAPRHRSRSLRRVFKRITRGVKLVHERRKPKKRTCSITGSKLSGIKRGIPSKMKSLNKSQKRPERPYGGVLCSRCLKKLMVEKARVIKLK